MLAGRLILRVVELILRLRRSRGAVRALRLILRGTQLILRLCSWWWLVLGILPLVPYTVGLRVWLPVRNVGALLGLLGGVDIEALIAVFDLVPRYLQGC